VIGRSNWGTEHEFLDLATPGHPEVSIRRPTEDELVELISLFPDVPGPRFIRWIAFYLRLFVCLEIDRPVTSPSLGRRLAKNATLLLEPEFDAVLSAVNLAIAKSARRGHVPRAEEVLRLVKSIAEALKPLRGRRGNRSLNKFISALIVNSISFGMPPSLPSHDDTLARPTSLSCFISIALLVAARSAIDYLENQRCPLTPQKKDRAIAEFRRLQAEAAVYLEAPGDARALAARIERMRASPPAIRVEIRPIA
jgi:hypothetical protein